MSASALLYKQAGRKVGMFVKVKRWRDMKQVSTEIYDAVKFAEQPHNEFQVDISLRDGSSISVDTTQLELVEFFLMNDAGDTFDTFRYGK